ncbi:MAG: transglycosylase SLT domain-containing protein [Candidatus Binatia bacterium]
MGDGLKGTAGAEPAGRRRRPRRHAPRRAPREPRRRLTWKAWLRTGAELVALLGAALIGVIVVLGQLADWFAGVELWWHLVPFAAAVLVFAVLTAVVLRAWLGTRRWLARRGALLPALVAVAIAATAGWFAGRPAFDHEVTSLRALVGGTAAAERVAIAHQVYAAYRRSNLDQQLRVLERGRVYEPTVYQAAAAFGVDPEVLMGVAAAESSFYPRDSADGGRGLFQLTTPPKTALAQARRRLGRKRLDPLNQRHNAFVAAATLRRYLDEMGGDLFLGLLAYNIGPRNGGLRSIMKHYGARDFVTIQPYLKHLPRDYPIRVLAAALAYRLWRTDGHLPRYERGDNAIHVQGVGIPGLKPSSEPARAARAP